jgi:hypothetical protein
MRLLVFFLLSFSFFSNADIDKETQIIRQLQAEMQDFRMQLQRTDRLFAELREPRLTAKEKDDTLNGLFAATSRASLHWRGMQRILEKARAETVDLHRQGLLHRVPVDSDVQALLAFDKNNQIGYGSPLPLLIKAWRGLSYGQKVELLPPKLRTTELFPTATGFLKIKLGDSVIAMMPNGGLIRGEVQGWRRDGQIVIRELLPSALKKFNRRQGVYRIFDLMKASRFELMNIPSGPATSLSPASLIDLEGYYARHFVRVGHIFRVELQPTDVELMRAAQHGQSIGLTAPFSMPVNIRNEHAPKFAEVFFENCESSLSAN